MKHYTQLKVYQKRRILTKPLSKQIRTHFSKDTTRSIKEDTYHGNTLRKILGDYRSSNLQKLQDSYYFCLGSKPNSLHSLLYLRSLTHFFTIPLWSGVIELIIFSKSLSFSSLRTSKYSSFTQ